jgi:hypothetical protein
VAMVDEAEKDWGKKEMAITATDKNRIMIFGPKTDGTYLVEFRTSEGDVLGFGLATAQAERVVSCLPPTSGGQAARCYGDFQKRQPHPNFKKSR